MSQLQVKRPLCTTGTIVAFLWPFPVPESLQGHKIMETENLTVAVSLANF